MLRQGDSSSAMGGWIAQSSFVDDDPLHLEIACTMASYLMEHGIAHHAQWFPGKENLVADALSRDFHVDDRALSLMITDCFSSHIPRSFQIISLPPAVIMCIGELLRLLPKMQQLLTEPATSVAAAGKDTWRSLTQLGTNIDPYLERLDRGEQLELLSCFAPAVRERWSSSGTAECAVGAQSGWQAGSVRATLESVAKAFRAHKLGSPMHDA